MENNLPFQRLQTIPITKLTVSTITAILMVTSEDIVKVTKLFKNLKTKEAIGDVYCFNKTYKRETFEFLDADLTTPRSNRGWRKEGAWSLVHKVLFTLQEHVTKTETDETRFLSAKRKKCYLTSKGFLLLQFNQPNIARKQRSLCMWTTKFKKIITAVYCPTYKNE